MTMTPDERWESVDSGTPERRPLSGRWNPDMAWPVGITVALTLVILVNIVFIVYAVNTSDTVDASYVQGER